MDLDIRKFNACVDGYLHRREDMMNDFSTVGHVLAGKVAAAVWGDRSFRKPIKEFKLKEESGPEAALRRTLACLREKGVNV